MRATSFFLPLAFAFAASALDLSFGPDTVCGNNAVKCGNNFCCSEGNKCDTSGTITKCGDDGTLALPYGVGDIASAVASQAHSAASDFKSAINEIPLSSLMGEVGSLATAFPTAALSSILANGDQSALESIMTALPSAARPAISSLVSEVQGALGVTPTGNGQPQNTGAQGGASMVGARTFGNTAALVGMIWGVAAIGGAILVL